MNKKLQYELIHELKSVLFEKLGRTPFMLSIVFPPDTREGLGDMATLSNLDPDQYIPFLDAVHDTISTAPEQKGH